MKRGKKTEAKKAKERADRLCGRLVRSRGACERCGKKTGLQWAHIVRRNWAATRVDETNAWCLCPGCHLLTEAEADEFMALVEKTIGLDHYFALKAKARAGVKTSAHFWAGECERLEALLNDRGIAA